MAHHLWWVSHVIAGIPCEAYHGVMPRLRHYDSLNTARFVTFSCYRRHRYLADRLSRDMVLEEITALRDVHKIKVLGYVVMPEHIHLVLHPPDDLELGRIIGQFKARSARAILSHCRQSRGQILVRPDGRPAVWHRRCYDHNCRTAEIVLEKIRYCHDNPVKRGLASRPEDWPWSSYRWYHGRRNDVLEIDGYEA